MKYLKSKEVVHRDLKLENILLTSKDLKFCSIKIGDFGLSDVLQKSKKKRLINKCGTPGFYYSI